MFSKRSAHGVIRGVTKRPFYIKKTAYGYLLLVKSLLNSNHELMKGCFHRLPSLVCMLVGLSVKISSLKNISISLSMVLSKNDVRMIGLKSLGPL
jgi:hypothetical protein